MFLALALAAATIAADVAVAASNLPAKSAASTDVTDIWWNRNEPGWGMQLVQTGTFAFATLYIYGPDGSPTFVTAELELGPGTTFTGPLYVSRGPYFGGPYTAGAFQYRQAGTMTFKLIGPDTGTLAYSIDGVAVSKPVERQPLTLDDYNGQFAVVSDGTASGCYDPSDNGYAVGGMALEIEQNGTSMHVDMIDLSTYLACTADGQYSQLGRDGQFSAPFFCLGQNLGTITLSEMRIDIGRVSGRLTMTASETGCRIEGYFVGLTPGP